MLSKKWRLVLTSHGASDEAAQNAILHLRQPAVEQRLYAGIPYPPETLIVINGLYHGIVGLPRAVVAAVTRTLLP